MRKAVELFAESMEGVLRDNDDKSGWGSGDCTLGYLEYRLVQELAEYFKEHSAYELLDLANFAMMIYNRRLGTGNYK